MKQSPIILIFFILNLFFLIWDMSNNLGFDNFFHNLCQITTLSHTFMTIFLGILFAYSLKSDKIAKWLSIFHHLVIGGSFISTLNFWILAIINPKLIFYENRTTPIIVELYFHGGNDIIIWATLFLYK
jgi:hypothetical protein